MEIATKEMQKEIKSSLTGPPKYNPAKKVAELEYSSMLID